MACCLNEKDCISVEDLRRIRFIEDKFIGNLYAAALPTDTITLDLAFDSQDIHVYFQLFLLLLRLIALLVDFNQCVRFLLADPHDANLEDFSDFVTLVAYEAEFERIRADVGILTALDLRLA